MDFGKVNVVIKEISLKDIGKLEKTLDALDINVSGQEGSVISVTKDSEALHLKTLSRDIVYDLEKLDISKYFLKYSDSSKGYCLILSPRSNPELMDVFIYNP